MLKNYMNLKTRTGIGFDVHRLVPKKKTLFRWFENKI